MSLLVSPRTGRLRRWLVASTAGGLVLVLVADLALLFGGSLIPGLGVGRLGLSRSLDQVLERGERHGERIVVELTGAELADVIIDGMDAAGVSLAELTVDVAPADRPDRGRLRFHGRMADRQGSFQGRAILERVGDELELSMEAFDLRGYELPGVANSLAGELVADAADVDAYLENRGLRLRDVSFSEDLMRLVAVEVGSTAGNQAGRRGSGTDRGEADEDTPEGEPQVPPGEAHRPVMDGDPMVLVLGDSVAAGMGVDDFTESYASRVHAWLERRDGADYGLVDLADPGETSWSLREEGQLDRGLAWLDRSEPALIVLDIGANDLLSALRHPACADDITSDSCRALVDGRLDDYRATFAATLADLREAVPRAPLVVMTTYNPFSFGTGSAFEQRSEEVVAQLNGITRRLALRHGARVADAATPFEDRATDLTHMSADDAPDVHPNAAGYDTLAAALIDALQRPTGSRRLDVR